MRLLAFSILALFISLPAVAEAANNTDLIEIAEVENLINDFAVPLRKAAALQPDRIKVRIVVSKSRSLFWLNRETLYVTSGYLARSKSADTLFARLAHELGHLMKGHLKEGREAFAKKKAKISMIQFLLGDPPDLDRGTCKKLERQWKKGSPPEGVSRDCRSIIETIERAQEYEADQIAITLLKAADQSPMSLVEEIQEYLGQELFAPEFQEPDIRIHPGTRLRAEKIVVDPDFVTKPLPEDWQQRHEGMKVVIGLKTDKDFGRCFSGGESYSPDHAIESCGAMIQSGQWSGKLLASAFQNRGAAYFNRKDLDRAFADYDEAIRLEPTAERLNSRCWRLAKADKTVSKALDDCDEALRLKPNFGFALNSRGLVHLKLGAFDKAIADYSAHLQQNPKGEEAANSFYGRGLAKRHSGDEAGGLADIAAAKALKADIADAYAGYGLN